MQVQFVFSQGHDDLDDYIKQADKLFESDDFKAAYPYYQTLRSNNVGDADYNFRLGVCMMFSEPENKTRPIDYFNIALKLEIEDNRIYYYLGRALHNNYRFSEAQDSYKSYKELAKRKLVASFDIDRRIQECANGISLLSHIKLLYVMEKQLVRDKTFYKSYNFKESSGRVIAVPPSLMTKYDKKHNSPKFGVYVAEGNVLYYASYGKKGVTGLDIYRAKQLDGNWGEVQSIGDGINTPYDDAYPYISGDGRTLYFSSKGHNSMGGYDVFSSSFSLSSFDWTACENLNFPTNTPFDDLFYVPDTSGTKAYFSSDRQSVDGEIYVYHIGLDFSAEEQDFSKIFREGGDATDVAKLLKDIAELKTNIKIEDYKKKIEVEKEKEIAKAEEVKNKSSNNTKVIAKVDIDDYAALEQIVDESYNEYKKIQYKSIKLQRKRNVIGKIISENKDIAIELKAKGDSESMLEAGKYIKAAAIATEVAQELDKQIIATQNDAQLMMEQTAKMQEFVLKHDKDSVNVTYQFITEIKKRNNNLPNIAIAVKEQQLALIQAKRDRAFAMAEKSKALAVESNDLNEELNEYKTALGNSQDEEEKQEYKEMIAIITKDIAVMLKKKASLDIESDSLLTLANKETGEAEDIENILKSSTDFVDFGSEKEISSDELAVIDEKISTNKRDFSKNIDSFKAAAIEKNNELNASIIAENNSGSNIENNDSEGTQAISAADNNSYVVDSINSNKEVLADADESNNNDIDTNSVDTNEVIADNGIIDNTADSNSVQNANSNKADNVLNNSDSNMANLNDSTKEQSIIASSNSNGEDDGVNSSSLDSENSNSILNDTADVGDSNLATAENIDGKNQNSGIIEVDDGNSEAQKLNEREKNNLANVDNRKITFSTIGRDTNNVIESKATENQANGNSEVIAANENSTENTANNNGNTNEGSNENSNTENNANSTNTQTENTSNGTSGIIAANENSTENTANNNNENTNEGSNENSNTENNANSANNQTENTANGNSEVIAANENSTENTANNNGNTTEGSNENSNTENNANSANNQTENSANADIAIQNIESANAINAQLGVSAKHNEVLIEKLKAIAVKEYKIAEQKEEQANVIISKYDNNNATINDMEFAKTLLLESKTHKIRANVAIEKIKEGELIQEANSEILMSFNNTNNASSNSSINDYSQLSDADIENNAIANDGNNIEATSFNSFKINVANNSTIDGQKMVSINNESVLDNELAESNLGNTSKVQNNNEISLANDAKEYIVAEIENNNISLDNISEFKSIEENVATKSNEDINNNIANIEEIENEQIIASINMDSVFVPDYKVESMSVASDKYLAPTYDEIQELKTNKQVNNSNLSRSVQLSQVYFDTQKSIEADIDELNTQIKNADNPKRKSEILLLRKSKEDQLLAVERKAVAAAIYSKLLYKQTKKYDSAIVSLERDFKENRDIISAGDKSKINSINTVEYIDKSSLNLSNYQNELSKELLQASTTKAGLETAKSNLLSKHEQAVQKQDKLNNDLLNESSKSKKRKINTKLNGVNSTIIAYEDSINTIDNSIAIEEIRITKNQNIISEFNAISQYIEVSEPLSNADTALISEVNLIENLSFDENIFEPKNSVISADNTTISETEDALNQSENDVARNYYYGNSSDLVYVKDVEIAQVKRMLLIKKKLMIDEELDILNNIGGNEYADRKKELEQQRTIIAAGELELIKYLEENNAATDDLRDIDDERVIDDLYSQSERYRSLSLLLSDSANNAQDENKDELFRLSSKLQNYADTMSMLHFELSAMKNENEIQRNNIVMVKMYQNSTNDIIRSQAVELFNSAKLNSALAKKSRNAINNPNISDDEREQFISQAYEYEELSISDQRKAIRLLKTETIIASNSDGADNEANTDSNTTSELSNTSVANNATDLDNTASIDNNNQTTEEQNKNVYNQNSVSFITVDTDIRNIKLSELYRVNTANLTTVQAKDYQIRKADILGIYVASKSNDKEEFYNSNNKIEINTKIPMGLIYKVQIAAFRKVIPNNTFKGLKPISAEKIPKSAFTRYMAGLFVNISDASSAKTNIRRIGYKDAFVVAYFNGKRISMSAARKLIASGNAYTDASLAASSDKLNVKNYGASTDKQAIASANTIQSNGVQLESVAAVNSNTVVYSVQIGVFGGLRTAERLNNAPSIFYDKTANGYFRYFSGTFSADNQARARRAVIRANGFKDAFIVAFINGKRISLTKARTLSNNNNATSNTVNNVNSNSSTANTVANSTANENNAMPSGIVYKVQIGAFRSLRSGTQLQELESTSANGLDNYSNSRGLIVYTSKAYTSYQRALSARGIIRNKGPKDAFIIAFENGKRISVRDARNR